MGVAIMPKYSVFFCDPTHYITQTPQIIECAGDQEAIQKAKQFIDGRDIELWEKARLIARFPRTSGK
jgi:hypothetical protein